MKKEQKKIPIKKLPSNLKKTYTEKTLEKNLLKKLYISADREFLAAQFVPDEKDPAKRRIVCAEYDAKDFARLKSLAKQIRRQKGRVKLLPFAAAVLFAVAVTVFVIFFKDPLAKKGLTTVLQKLTGAKVDIASVHVALFDSSVTVLNLAAADKNSPMKNIFEAQKMELDFNLTQLLKRRFVCENLEISGMAFGTERKISGELPKSTKKEKKAVNAEAKESKTAERIRLRQKEALEQSKTVISSMFESLNPQSFLDKALKQLETPSAAQQAQETIGKIIPVWEKRPAEFEEAVNGFKSNAEKVVNRDYQSIKNIGELKSALEDLNGAIRDGKKLSSMSETTINDLQKDSKAVQKAAQEVSAAVKKDTDFINKEINKIRSFTVSDGKNIFAQTISAAAYGVFGKYYPYVQATFNAVVHSNSQKKGKPADTQRRHTTKRMAGRTIEYRSDIYPSFLIQRVFANGTGFEGRLSDISNDPDRWGKPAQFTVHLDESLFSASSKRTHEGEGTVNTGEKLNYPLLKMRYTGKGYNASFNPASLLQAEVPAADIAGIPSFTGQAKVSAAVQAEKDGSFAVDADFDFDRVLLTAKAFEPAFISRIYAESLAAVKNMSFQVKAGFAQADLKLDVKTNADKLFIAALQAGINKELSDIKQKALKEAQAELEKYTGPFDEKLGAFAGIEKGIMGQKQVLDTMQKQLEERKNEITKRIEQAGKEALNKAASQAQDAAADALKDAAGGALKGLFGR